MTRLCATWLFAVSSAGCAGDGSLRCVDDSVTQPVLLRFDLARVPEAQEHREQTHAPSPREDSAASKSWVVNDYPGSLLLPAGLTSWWWVPLVMASILKTARVYIDAGTRRIILVNFAERTFEGHALTEHEVNRLLTGALRELSRMPSGTRQRAGVDATAGDRARGACSARKPTLDGRAGCSGSDPSSEWVRPRRRKQP